MVEIKAQLTIQYLASFIFFIGLVVLVYLAYSANIPRFVKEVEKENIYSKAYQLSEVLVNNPGEPADWNDIIDIKRLGLSDQYWNKSNLISNLKVQQLSGLNCYHNDEHFKRVQGFLDLNRSFSIFIFNITEDGNRQLLFDCVPSAFPRAAVNATVKRIATLNNSGKMELAEIIVQM
ncbi:MAG: hypothetical protein QMD36_02975 [Candidatus Aenigmarchaeota archaeon]|nr:hypothetical protein [Candidatus Aenigmarchaeota archaeon]